MQMNIEIFFLPLIVYNILLGLGLHGVHYKFMEVHSHETMRISVRSLNQGLQISHSSLNSNYQRVPGVG